MEGTARGTLGGTPLPTLLASLSGARRSGSLHLASATHGDHVLVFRDGAPAKLRTSFPVPDLGLALVALGRLDDFAYRSTFDLAAGDRANAIELVARGLVTEADVALARREQQTRVLAAIVRRMPSSATYFFADGVDDLVDQDLVPIALADALARAGAVPAPNAPPPSFGPPVYTPPPNAPRDPSPAYASAPQPAVASHAPSTPFALAGWNTPIRSSAASPARAETPMERGPKRLRYLAIALGLLPLVLASFAPVDELRDRVKRTLATHPEIGPLLQRTDLTIPQLLSGIPGHKLDGALLGFDSHMHWVFALLAAALWLLAVLLLFERGNARANDVPKVGVFTGTAGIVLLLGVQWIAELSQGVWLNGASIITVFFYVIKFIGFSYRAAMDPSNGFLVSFFGFTFGVGLCEEATKAIPLFWGIRRERALDWRGACSWGLASGVGFGVAEGVMYSADYYNGLSSGGMYVTRFVSCVALHALWSATVALSIFEHQTEFQGSRRWFELVFAFVKNAFVPMLLHGLYDTLLKKQMSVAALAVAVCTFGWFALRLERVRRRALEAEAAFAGTPAA